MGLRKVVNGDEWGAKNGGSKSTKAHCNCRVEDRQSHPTFTERDRGRDISWVDDGPASIWFLGYLLI